MSARVDCNENGPDVRVLARGLNKSKAKVKTQAAQH